MLPWRVWCSCSIRSAPGTRRTYATTGRPGFQLLALSLLPYLYVFLLGVLLQKNFLRWARFLKYKALICASTYVLLAVLLNHIGLNIETHVPNLLSMSALAAAIIAAAYTDRAWRNVC